MCTTASRSSGIVPAYKHGAAIPQTPEDRTKISPPNNSSLWYLIREASGPRRAGRRRPLSFLLKHKVASRGITLRYRAIVLADDSDIRSLLWTILDIRGYEVFTFPDPGLCPLHSVGECPCPGTTACADLIVSDMRFWEGKDVDFIEQLVHKGCKQNHFALVCDASRDEKVRRAAQLGCAVFPRPLNLTRFLTWLEAVEGTIPKERSLFNWK